MNSVWMFTTRSQSGGEGTCETDTGEINGTVGCFSSEQPRIISKTLPSANEDTRDNGETDKDEDIGKRLAVRAEDNTEYYVPKPTVCDACPNCSDTCELETCRPCELKRRTVELTIRSHDRAYTFCEVSRHKTLGSCWLVADGCVYDVTAFLPYHTAGIGTILKYGGGRDCTQDFLYHSKSGQVLWNKYKIGRVKDCGEPGPSNCVIA